MTIASVGNVGVTQDPTSNNQMVLVYSVAVQPADQVIIVVASDNTSTTDGDNGEVVSVVDATDVANTYVKLGEYVNGSAGAAAGVLASVWYGHMLAGSAGALINFASNRTDKCASGWRFSVDAGKTLAKTAGVTNPVANEVNASNGFGSAAFSGLPSIQRLYFRGLGKEANSTTNITPSTGFTVITPNRSRNNASAVLVRGEFRINTSAGETSNPTLAVSGDTAGVFLALEEVARPSTVILLRRRPMRHMIVR